MANEHEREGFIDRMKGKAEKIYGELTDDERAKDKGEAHERQGDLESLKGKVARTADDAKETATQAKESIDDALHRR